MHVIKAHARSDNCYLITDLCQRLSLEVIGVEGISAEAQNQNH